DALHERVLVAAFDAALLGEFRRLSRGSVATGASQSEVLRFLMAVRLGVSGWPALSYDALQVPVAHAGITVVDRAFVRAAHARDLAVHVWTIDEPAEMERLL